MSDNTVISLKNATICQENTEVLSDVNINITEGEFLYLIGKVGSGKSSIIKTLYAELPLKKGNGSIAGYDLNKLKQKNVPFLRRKLGIVFQDFQLLTDRTIYDNLLFVLKATGWRKKKEIENRIHEVLDKVGLLDKIKKMPHQLSGGEQQRVVIARALLNNPDIILADEPTGNLDPETSEEIMELLFNISNNGKAIVMATHNYTLIKKFPARTIKCQNGKITEIKEAENIMEFIANLD